MFEATLYVFYVLLFPANGELSYTIFRTGIDPSNLKLKIGGTIELPVYVSDSDETLRKPEDDIRLALRTPNATSSEQKSPPTQDRASNVTEETDHGNDKTDTTRESEEHSGSEGNVPKDTSPKKIAQINTSSETKENKVRESEEHSGSEGDVPKDTSPKKLAEINTSSETKANKVRNRSKAKHAPKPTKPHDEEEEIPPKVFLAVSPSLRIITTTATKKPKPQKVQDDERIRNFSSHVYKQALKAFESMKKKADPYTQSKIDSLAESYKEKFRDFVKRTRDVSIKTNDGAQNAILHTIDTSNLIMERIVNFLKTDMHGSGTSALRQGGATRLQKEVDILKATEFEHACKTFGICRSAQGFRHELQNIISILISLPDSKLLQVNDAATEILKAADLSAFTNSNPIQDLIRKAIKRQEKTSAATLRSHLEILFGVLSKSHQPLIVDTAKSFEESAVNRTISFHSLLDGLEDALPPNESNKKEWGLVKSRLQRWKDGGLLDVQETLEALFNNVNSGIRKYAGAGRIREKIRDIVKVGEE